MYIISNNTLFLYSDNFKTIVKEKDSEYEFMGNLLKYILNKSCIYYGSSLKGRMEGAKNLINGKYKLPIIISEKNNILFFPLKGAKNNEIIWLNFNQIKNFQKNKNQIEVTFLNGYTHKFFVSFTIFNNQMFKCSRLWLVYLTRS